MEQEKKVAPIHIALSFPILPHEVDLTKHLPAPKKYDSYSEIVYGDMNGCVINVIWSLRYEGIIQLNEDDYNKILGLYNDIGKNIEDYNSIFLQKCKEYNRQEKNTIKTIGEDLNRCKNDHDLKQLNERARCYLESFNGLLYKITLSLEFKQSAGRQIFLGDVYSDRGNNDLLTLLFFDRLKRLGFKYEFVYSNHDHDLIVLYTELRKNELRNCYFFDEVHRPFGPWASNAYRNDFQRRSRYGLENYILRDLVSDKQVQNLIKNNLVCKEVIKLITYSFNTDKQKINLFTHAPSAVDYSGVFQVTPLKDLTAAIENEKYVVTLKDLAAMFGVDSSFIGTPLRLASVIDDLNNKFFEFIIYCNYSSVKEDNEKEKKISQQMSKLEYFINTRLSHETQFLCITPELLLATLPDYVNCSVFGHLGKCYTSNALSDRATKLIGIDGGCGLVINERKKQILQGKYTVFVTKHISFFPKNVFENDLILALTSNNYTQLQRTINNYQSVSKIKLGGSSVLAFALKHNTLTIVEMLLDNFPDLAIIADNNNIFPLVEVMRLYKNKDCKDVIIKLTRLTLEKLSDNNVVKMAIICAIYEENFIGLKALITEIMPLQKKSPDVFKNIIGSAVKQIVVSEMDIFEDKESEYALKILLKEIEKHGQLPEYLIRFNIILLTLEQAILEKSHNDLFKILKKIDSLFLTRTELDCIREEMNLVIWHAIDCAIVNNDLVALKILTSESFLKHIDYRYLAFKVLSQVNHIRNREALKIIFDSFHSLFILIYDPVFSNSDFQGKGFKEVLSELGYNQNDMLAKAIEKSAFADNDFAVKEVLSRRYIDPNKPVYNIPPLFYAINQKQNPKVIKALLDKGADPDKIFEINSVPGGAEKYFKQYFESSSKNYKFSAIQYLNAIIKHTRASKQLSQKRYLLKFLNDVHAILMNASLSLHCSKIITQDDKFHNFACAINLIKNGIDPTVGEVGDRAIDILFNYGCIRDYVFIALNNKDQFFIKFVESNNKINLKYAKCLLPHIETRKWMRWFRDLKYLFSKKRQDGIEISKKVIACANKIKNININANRINIDIKEKNSNTQQQYKDMVRRMSQEKIVEEKHKISLKEDQAQESLTKVLMDDRSGNDETYILLTHTQGARFF